jgi:hypothetical protein
MRFKRGECSASCLVDGPCASDFANQDLAAVGATPLCRLAELLAWSADRGFDARPAIRTSVLIPVILRCAHISRNVTPSWRTLAVARWAGRGNLALSPLVDPRCPGAYPSAHRHSRKRLQLAKKARASASRKPGLSAHEPA